MKRISLRRFYIYPYILLSRVIAKKSFDYPKWDNIELSDDESDLHPNIDKVGCTSYATDLTAKCYRRIHGSV